MHSRAVFECPPELVASGRFCVPCPQGRYKSRTAGECVATCEEGTYASSYASTYASSYASQNGGAESPGFCAACDPSCLACSSAGVCSACRSNSTRRYLQSGQCVASCSLGHYLRAATCFPCARNCWACSSSQVCLRCQPRVGVFLQLGKCVGQCRHGTYGNQHTGRCADCSPDCAQCTELGCTRCKLPSLLVEWPSQPPSCAPACPAAHRPAQGRCQPCYGSCLSCFSPERDGCLTCRPGLWIRNHTCYAACPLGTFPSPEGACRPCAASCRECDPGGRCLRCWDWALSGDVDCPKEAEECDGCSKGGGPALAVFVLIVFAALI